MKIKVTARKWGGDDTYSWAIFRSDRNKPVWTGLSKPEVNYYKRLTLEIIEKEKKNGI